MLCITLFYSLVVIWWGDACVCHVSSAAPSCLSYWCTSTSVTDRYELFCFCAREVTVLVSLPDLFYCFASMLLFYSVFSCSERDLDCWVRTRGLSPLVLNILCWRPGMDLVGVSHAAGRFRLLFREGRWLPGKMYPLLSFWRMKDSCLGLHCLSWCFAWLLPVRFLCLTICF